jgi:ssDNA-binding Zn-finger/Zn-ribbon topoisomerase 1
MYRIVSMEAHSMVVTVLSETQQEYDGKVYWLCGPYYQRYGIRLHRVVWAETHEQAIPKGYDVHHIDGNRANNEPENLALLTRAQHMSHHHKGNQRGFPPEARAAAAQWHGSVAGKAWHDQHYDQFKDRLHRQETYICEQCGKGFRTQTNGRNRFCSNACKTRWRFLSGKDNEARTCAYCGRIFLCNKYIKKRSCSPQCAGFLARKSPNG